jgi:hypothetical protein
LRKHLCIAACLGVLVAACGGGGEDDGTGGSGGGHATGPLTMLLPSGPPTFTTIADRSDGLFVPRDLSFNPGHPGELWIVSLGDESVTLVFDATTGAKKTEYRKDGYAMHFMAKVSSIDFGDRTFENEYTFGTCGESENTYDDQAPPNFYMGPVLWSSKLDIFAVQNPIGLGSHIDMLHESPDCMGIAHDHQNVYWAFDGYHGLLARYDFRKDHGVGMDDHSDGIIEFLAEPTVARLPDVPSHLEYDKDAQLLYVADTGNARVLRVDVKDLHKVADLPQMDPGTQVSEVDGAKWTELVPASGGLQAPSGIALHGGTLYVSDNYTGEIHAFDLEGHLTATMQTGLPSGSLMGLTVGPDERLYFVDAGGNRVLRVEL